MIATGGLYIVFGSALIFYALDLSGVDSIMVAVGIFFMSIGWQK